jgi:hypothetical protein
VGFLPGLLSIGFRAGGFRGRFRGHVGLSFVGSRAAGRGRGGVREEIARFVVNRLAPADSRSVAYLGPLYRAFGA